MNRITDFRPIPDTLNIECAFYQSKHLAYISKLSEGLCVVRPIHYANDECWSNTKKISEIIHDQLIITIEFVKEKIIIGASPHHDIFSNCDELPPLESEDSTIGGMISDLIRDMIAKIGPVLIVEQGNQHYKIGRIRECEWFSYQNEKQTIELYSNLFQKFVKESRMVFAKSQFPVTNNCSSAHSLTKPNGDWLKSNPQEANKKFTILFGNGQLTMPSGEIHQGFFVKGKLQEGRIKYPNGDYLQGEFINQGFTGEGKYTLQDNSVAHGKFKDGEFIEGELFFPNGDRLKGEFKEFGFSGEGKYTYPDGCIEEGLFEYGRLVQGTHQSADGTILEGSFKYGEFIEGKYIFPNGSTVTGTFKGRGRQMDEGFISEGLFHNGELFKGKITAPDGASIEGNFYKYKIHKYDFYERLQSKKKYRDQISKKIPPDDPISLIQGAQDKEDWQIQPAFIIEGRLSKRIQPNWEWIEGTVPDNEPPIIPNNSYYDLPTHSSIKFFKWAIPEYLKRTPSNIKRSSNGFYDKSFSHNKWEDDTITILNNQLPEKFSKYLHETFRHAADTRYISIKNIKYFYEIIDKNNNNLNKKITNIIDVDTSIWFSIFSILNTKPSKIAFDQSFEKIIDEYRFMRYHRALFLESSYSRKNTNYFLYKLDEKGEFTLIAEKTPITTNCDDPDFFRIPSKEELRAIGQITITENLISQAFFPSEVREVLKSWLGFTIEQAIDEHVKPIKKKTIIHQNIKFNLINNLHSIKDNIHFSPLKTNNKIQSKIDSWIYYRISIQIKELKNNWPRFSFFGLTSSGMSTSTNMLLNRLGRIYNCQKFSNFVKSIYLSDLEKKIIENKFLFILENKSSTLLNKPHIDEIPIKKNNAIIALKIIKIIGLIDPATSTYFLRQAVLKKAPSDMSTAEIFTKSLHPKDYQSLEYLSDPSHWVDERVAMQEFLKIDYQYCARSLSAKMGRIILAPRGNTGVGKTSLMRQCFVKYILPDFLELYLHQTDEFLNGVLNPDHVKALLKIMDGKPLLNKQVYLEGRMLFEHLLNSSNPIVNGTIIDTRLLDLDDLQRIVHLARKKEAKVKILDIDAPIWFSILSVLNRDPYGADPCVSFDVIKQGYIDSRTNRRAFIAASQESHISYTLYRIGKAGNYIKVARKKENEDILDIMLPEALEGCLKTPIDEEIERIGHTIITAGLTRSLDIPREKEVMRQWIGYTIKEALELHSQGKSGQASSICSTSYS